VRRRGLHTRTLLALLAVAGVSSAGMVLVATGIVPLARPSGSGSGYHGGNIR